MTTGLLAIGSSALEAAYTALRTSGNNIANANTPGYSREVTSFVPQIENRDGSNYLGTGVSVASVTRVFSDFLAQQTNQAQAQSSQADSMAQLTSQVDSLFANSSNGLGAAIDSFFTQIQSLAAQPASAATRQSLLSAAQQMTGQFNDMASQLQRMRQGADQQLAQQIASVNTATAQIASLNQQIQQAAASGATPNSLLDQRNQAILTLNQTMGVTSSTQSDGSINLYLANGQPLVVGTKSYTMAMGTDPLNAQNIVVGTQDGTAIAALDPSNTGGGTIGALLKFRSQTLPTVENQVGQLAVVLASKVNAIQAQGLDQNGNAGAPFFTIGAPTVSAAPANTDAGSVTVSAAYSDVSQLQAADYQLKALGGGKYALTRLSDNTTTNLSALPATVDGVTLSVSGTPAAGDVFTIQPVRLGAAQISVAINQGAQIAAASPIQATLAKTNSGSLAVSNLGLQPLPANPNANLQHPVQIRFISATQYTITEGGVTSAPQSYKPGQAITYNGWSLTLTGTPADGDVVNVGPGAVQSGDNRNAQLMGQLQQQTMVGGVTLDNAYAGAVADVGTIAAAAQAEQKSAAAQLTNATTAESSVSGVNLDEEASALMRYQQQYQAAAKLIQTATNVFDAIIAVAGAN